MQSFYMAVELEQTGAQTQGRAIETGAMHSERELWLQENGLPPQLDISRTSIHPLGVDPINVVGSLSIPDQYLGLGQTEEIPSVGIPRLHLSLRDTLAATFGLGAVYAGKRLVDAKDRRGATDKVDNNTPVASTPPPNSEPASHRKILRDGKLDRRNFIRLSTLTVAGAALAACGGSSPPGDPKPPVPARENDRSAVGPTPTIAIDKRIIEKEPQLTQFISNPTSTEAQRAFQDYVTGKARPVMAAYDNQFKDYPKQPDLYVAMMEAEEAGNQYDIWIKVEGESGRSWVYTGWDEKGENGRFVQTLPGMEEQAQALGKIGGVKVTGEIWIPKYRGFLVEFPNNVSQGRKKEAFFDPRIGMTVSIDDNIPEDKVSDAETYLFGPQDGGSEETNGIAPVLSNWVVERDARGVPEDQMMIVKYDEASGRFYSYIAAAQPSGIDYFFADVENNQLQIRNIDPIPDRSYLLNYITSELEIVSSDNMVVGMLDQDGRALYFDQIATVMPIPTESAASPTRTPIAQVEVTFTPTVIPTASATAKSAETAIPTPTPKPIDTVPPLPTLTPTKAATLTPTLTPEPPATPTLEQKARALGDKIILKFRKKDNETVRQDLVEIAYKAPTARELWQALANDPGYLKDFGAAYREDFPDLDLEELVSTLYSDPTELFADVLSIGPSDQCENATCFYLHLTTKYDRSYGIRVVSGMKGGYIEISSNDFRLAGLSDQGAALGRQESIFKEAMSITIMRELFNQGRVDKLDDMLASQLADGLAIYLGTVYIVKNMPDNLTPHDIEHMNKARLPQLRNHEWIKPEPLPGK